MKQMISRKVVFGCALAMGASALVAPLSAQSVARVGDVDVSVEAVRAMLPELTPQQREALGNNPALLKQTVQAALLQEMLVRAAQSAHWDEDPRGAHAVQRARNAALAESYLNAIAAVPANYPQEREVRAVYEANLNQLMQPAQIQLSQIFVAEPQDADKEQLQALENKRSTIARVLGKDPSAEVFAATASDYSEEAASAKNGGALGWLPLEQVLPELRQALQGIEPGQTVGPVRLAGGWHWLRCDGMQESQPVAFELVRAQLAERMRAERMQANRQAYLTRLVSENPIAINEIALIQLVRSDRAALENRSNTQAAVPSNEVSSVRFVQNP